MGRGRANGWGVGMHRNVLGRIPHRPRHDHSPIAIAVHAPIIVNSKNHRPHQCPSRAAQIARSHSTLAARGRGSARVFVESIGIRSSMKGRESSGVRMNDHV